MTDSALPATTAPRGATPQPGSPSSCSSWASSWRCSTRPSSTSRCRPSARRSTPPRRPSRGSSPATRSPSASCSSPPVASATASATSGCSSPGSRCSRVASLACGLAQDSTQLIVARVVQGLGGGIFFPPVTALHPADVPAAQRAARPSRSWAPSSASRPRSARSSAGCSSRRSGRGAAGARSSSSTCRSASSRSIAAVILLPSKARGQERPCGRRPHRLPAARAARSSRSSCRSSRARTRDGRSGPTSRSIGGVVLLVLFALWERHVAARGTTPLVPPHLFSHPAVHRRARSSRWSTSRPSRASSSRSRSSGRRASATPRSSRASSRSRSRSATSSARRRATGSRSGSAAPCSSSAPALVAVGLIALWLVLLIVPTRRPHQLGPARPAARRRLRQRPVHRTERAVHRRDGRPLRGGRRERRDRHDAAHRRGDRHRGDRHGVLRQLVGPDRSPADAGRDRERLRAQRDLALAVSALFAVVAFALVFTLPKRVSRGYEVLPVE